MVLLFERYPIQKNQFTRQFTHIKLYHSKSQLDEMAILPCLIANGTNLGIFKMAGLCDLIILLCK